MAEETSGMDANTANLFSQLTAFVENVMSKTKADMEALINQKLSEKEKEKETEGEDHGDKNTGESSKSHKSGPVPYKTFKSCGAIEFFGKVDPIEAYSWLDEAEKAFDLSFCEEENKVRYASAMLKKQAHDWWVMISKSAEEAGNPIKTWKDFKARFIAQFCPVDMQRKYEREFLNLQQDNRSVTEYAAEFQRLAKYAAVYIPTEDMKVRRFVEGLKWEIQEFVPIRDVHTLELACEFAREREEKLIRKNAMVGAAPAKRAHTEPTPSFSVGRSTGFNSQYSRNSRPPSV